MATNKKDNKRTRKPGAGRKPIYADKLVKITLRIPQYQIDHISRIADVEGGLSAAARIILDRDISLHEWDLNLDPTKVERIKQLITRSPANQWEKNMRLIATKLLTEEEL